MKIEIIESVEDFLIDDLYQVTMWGYLGYVVKALEGKDINDVIERLRKRGWNALANKIDNVCKQLKVSDLKWLKELNRLMNYYRRYDISTSPELFKELITKMKEKTGYGS